MDQTLDHDGIGPQSDHVNNAEHEEEVPRPPPTALTPVKTRKSSILQEYGSPSSPGLRNRKSLSSSDGCHLSLSRDIADPELDADEINDGFGENNARMESEQDAQQHREQTEQQQQQPPPEDAVLLNSIWRTYDDVIILSLFSMFGIVFRIFSATWFRMELGVVFSEDSALGTNLPLNCCSCFLLGLFCSGR